MTTTARRTTPLTSTMFRRKAEALFLQANPGAADAEIEWTWQSRPFKAADGTKGCRNGRFIARASGHRSRLVTAMYVPGLGLTVN